MAASHYACVLITSVAVSTHREAPLSPAFSVRVRDDKHLERNATKRANPMTIMQHTSRHLAGAGSGVPKFTLGATRDASDASKYALFGLKPMPGANKLLGNC